LEGKGRLYYFLLSGEHPVMPLAELEALLEIYGGRIVYSFEGAALVEDAGDPEAIVARAGWVREAGILLKIVEADEDKVVEAVEEASKTLGEVRVEFRKFKAYSCHVDSRMLGAYKARGGTPLRVFVSEGVTLIGVPLARLDTRGFNERRPGRRPFFKPGPLSPQLSRVFVNLSRLPPGGVFLDPFCGTGGFVLEACLAGASVCVCSDIAEEMVRGSRVNLEHYGVYGRSLVAKADAAAIPVRDESVDAIATDPPYGRSTTTAKRRYEELVALFLDEARRILKPGGHVVYAGPASKQPWRLAVEAGLEVRGRYHMHVHGSLTREVVVARKVG